MTWDMTCNQFIFNLCIWSYCWSSYQFTFTIESTCLRFAWSISLQVVWSFFDQQTMLSCPQEMLMGLSDHVTLIQHFKDIQVCISLTNQLSDSNYCVVALCKVCTVYDTDPKTCVLQMNVKLLVYGLIFKYINRFFCMVLIITKS